MASKDEHTARGSYFPDFLISLCRIPTAPRLQTLFFALCSGELRTRRGMEQHLDLILSFISMGLSMGIIAGACFLKIPQLLTILKHQVRQEVGEG